MDGPLVRPKLPRYLREYGLSCRVLLAGVEGVPGYDFVAASALFIIDRGGLLAGVPIEFNSDLQEELDRRLPDLLAGKPTPGPVLWDSQIRPEGWGELWHDPEVAGVVSLTVAPATSHGPLEIGVLDSSRHLRRYSPQGALLGEATVEEIEQRRRELRGADLDGSGENEWLVAAGRYGMKVLDSQGQAYWEHWGEDADFEIAGVADLDGDGFKEVVVRSGDSVTALGSLGLEQWVLKSREPLSHVRVDVRGTVWAQSRRSLFPIDALGRAGPPVAPAFGGLIFEGETLSPQGERLLIYHAPRHLPFVDGEHDLDADGRKDIVVASYGGVAAYDGSGRTILSLSATFPKVALANLDGRPGDEMILFIEQYGLIALGKTGEPMAGNRGTRPAH